MVEIAEIKDRESLKAWLEETGQPREACISLAHRAAMRVMPVVADHFARTDRLSSLPVLRALLVSGVASGAPPALLKEAGHDRVRAAALADAADAAYAAATIADAVAARADAAARAYAAAARAAADAADAAADAAAIADVAAYAADVADAWAALRSDCQTLADNGNLFGRSLWPDSPEWAGKVWSHARSLMQQNGWQFWIDWYERALAGEPQPWPLLLEIALQEDAFWQGFDDEVMFRIYEIVGQYASEAVDQGFDDNQDNLIETAKKNSPNAERVFLNDQKQFDREPVTEVEGDIYEISLARVQDAIAEFKAIEPSDNLYGACDSEIERINRYLTQYRHVPLRIYEVLMRAVRRIDTRCKEGILTLSDDRLADFRGELFNSAVDIRQSDPRVKEVIQRRFNAKFDEMSAAELTDYRETLEAFADNSAPELAEELREDTATIADPEASAEDRAEARYRSGSRVVRMWELAHRSADYLGKFGKAGEVIGKTVIWIAGWFL